MIFLIGFEESTAKKVSALLPVYLISYELLNTKIGDIIRDKPNVDTYRKIECGKIVLMHGISKENLIQVIHKIRNISGKDIIFATTTPTSLNWTVKSLIDELEKEDDFFHRNK